MKHILIVDDDYDICDALQLILQERYQVSIAYNGKQALEFLLRHKVDAIVLDLMMPHMDGEALMRELHERGITTPVVFASAATHLGRRAQEAGAKGWLAKPFDAADLERVLIRVLGGSGGATSSGGDEGSDDLAVDDPSPRRKSLESLDAAAV